MAGAHGPRVVIDRPEAVDAPMEVGEPEVVDESVGVDEHEDVPLSDPPQPQSFTGWLVARLVGHEHAVLGGLLGLVAAALVLVLGVARAALVVGFVLLGSVIGACLDGDRRPVGEARGAADGEGEAPGQPSAE